MITFKCKIRPFVCSSIGFIHSISYLAIKNFGSQHLNVSTAANTRMLEFLFYYQQLSTALNGYQQLSTALNGYQQLSTAINGYQRLSTAING